MTDRHTPKQLFAAILLVALAITPLAASGTVEEPPIAEPVRELDHSADMRVADLMGMDVFRNGGPRVATIEDAIVDLGQGAVGYIVLRFAEDGLRTNDSLFPLPLYLFEQREDGRGLTLLLDDQSFIENMPTLDQATARTAPSENEWGGWLYSYWQNLPSYPDSLIQERRDRLQEYQFRFAAGPHVVPTAMVRATDLLETAVRNTAGRRIGELDDAVLNLTTAQLLLLSFDPRASLDAAESRYLIPLAAFTGNRRTGNITYDVERYGLAGPSGYTGTRPDFTSNEYHRRLARFWNTRDVATRYGSGMAIVPIRLTPASSLAGYELFTRDSRSPGEIVDTIINPDGSIDYVVIEFGAFLGSTNRRSVVPVSLLSLQPGSVGAVLNVVTEDLSDLPRYPAGSFVNTGAADWDSAVRAYWNNLYEVETGERSVGRIPTVSDTTSLPAGSPIPVSALLGYQVVSADGGTLGTVSSIQIDLVDSSVGFVAVTLDGGLFGGADVPVPVSAMNWQPSDGRITVDADRERLENAPGYDSIPVNPTLGFVTEVDAYWNQ